MKKELFQVDGLANETIKTQIKNALEKIEGVNKISVDLGRGTVAVSYNEPATKTNIASCIESTGHHIE